MMDELFQLVEKVEQHKRPEVLQYLLKRRREVFLAKRQGQDVTFKNDYWPLVKAIDIVKSAMEAE